MRSRSRTHPKSGLRVLLWGNRFPMIGGVERFSEDLSTALIARGHAVMGLTDGATLERVERGGQTILRLPISTARTLADRTAVFDNMARIQAEIAAFRPDVIHLNASGNELLTVLLTLRRRSIPLVYTAHNDVGAYIAPKHRKILHDVLAMAGRVSCVSPYIASRLAGDVDPQRIDVINNAIPQTPLPPVEPTPGLVLSYGRMIEDKGFDLTMAAFARIAPSRPQARLAVCGEGPLREALRASARDHGLADRVDLPGWVAPSEVPQWIARAGMVVVPSRWNEPFGLVALEAGMGARPCIAAAVGGLADIVVPERTGLLFERDDVDGLAGAMARLLDRPDEAAALGRAARAHVLAHYDHDAMTDRYVALYEDAVADHRERTASPAA